MEVRMRIPFFAMLVCVAGCATAGRPAPARHFTGDPYDVVERGGVLAGDVCGVTAEWAIEHDDGATQLVGRGIRHLEVRDEHGARHVTGELGLAQVDLWVSADRLVGGIGMLSVDLAADGDAYRGVYRITDDPHLGEMRLDGRQEILHLPREVLAALLPPMLHCERRGGFDYDADRITRQPVEVRFGGPAHYETARAGMW
jgi:hypothetical protein